MTELFMKKLADFVIKRRLLVLLVIAAITIFFGYKMTKPYAQHQFQRAPAADP